MTTPTPITTVAQATAAGAAAKAAGNSWNAPVATGSGQGGVGNKVAQNADGSWTVTSPNGGTVTGNTKPASADLNGYTTATGADVNAPINSDALNAPKVNVPAVPPSTSMTTLGQTVGNANASALDTINANNNSDVQTQESNTIGMVQKLFGGSSSSSQDALNGIIDNSGMKESAARITELRNQIALQTDYLNAGLSNIGDQTIATPIIGRQQRLLQDQQGRKIALLSAQMEAEQGNYAMAKDLVNMQYAAFKDDNDRQFAIKQTVLQQLDKFTQYNLDTAKMKLQNDYNNANKLEDTRHQILTNYYQAGGKAGSVATAIGDATSYDQLMAVGGQYTQTALEKAQLAQSKASTANSYSEIAARNAAASAAKAPDVQKINGVDAVWDAKSGQWVPATVAGQDTSNSAVTQPLQTKLDLIGNLISTVRSSGNAVGGNAISRLNPLAWVTNDRRDFIAGVQQLTSQETLDSLINAKKAGATFGALSEGEVKILSDSATKINNWAVKDSDGKVTGYATTPTSFTKELTRIQDLTKKALQEALPPGANLSQEDLNQVQQLLTPTSGSTTAFNPANFYK